MFPRVLSDVPASLSFWLRLFIETLSLQKQRSLCVILRAACKAQHGNNGATSSESLMTKLMSTNQNRVLTRDECLEKSLSLHGFWTQSLSGEDSGQHTFIYMFWSSYRKRCSCWLILKKNSGNLVQAKTSFKKKQDIVVTWFSEPSDGCLLFWGCSPLILKVLYTWSRQKRNIRRKIWGALSQDEKWSTYKTLDGIKREI